MRNAVIGSSKFNEYGTGTVLYQLTYIFRRGYEGGGTMCVILLFRLPIHFI